MPASRGGGLCTTGLTLLDGMSVGVGGGSVASDVAVAHLAALGCSVTGTDPRAVLPRAGAGQLTLSEAGGGRDALGVHCELDWAGPIELSLDGEIAVQAACGIMHVHGRKTGVPEPVALDCSSVYAGVLATQGMLAALVGQARGIGAHRVETSVAQAALLMVAQYLAAATASGGSVEPSRTGGPPFVSAEGVRFELEALDVTAWQRFWSLLDADRGAAGRGWGPFLCRYSTATCWLPHELHETAAQYSFGTLRAMADQAGASVVAVREIGECWEGWAPGGLRAAPWQILPTAMAPEPTGVPPDTSATSLPLDGLVVVEATRRIQGPLAGHILRLLGAQVIRVEPRGGDAARAVPPLDGECSARFTAINRGKAVVEADLSSPAGRALVRDLVAGADVFLHNWAPGKAASLDLDSDQLATVKPGLVYAYASGWGDALGQHPPLGTDYMVQAYSGLGAMVRPPGEPAAPSMMTLTDVLGGLVSAEGILAGLLARARSGRGQRVDSSLLSAATVLQAFGRRALGAADGCGSRGSPSRRRVQDWRAWTPLHRPLPTGDGWVALSSPSTCDLASLAEACAGPGAPVGPTFDDLAPCFRRESSSFWVDRLAEVGLTCTPVCTDLATLASDPRLARIRHAGHVAYLRPPWSLLP